MAQKEHVQPLMEALASISMESWNYWRIEHPDIRPDLRGVELTDANLSSAYLSYTDLSHADLSRTNLHHATLRYADLSSTILQKADLSGADLSYSILTGTDFTGAILHNAKLKGANLIGAILKDADLRGVDLAKALIDPKAIEGRKKRFRAGVQYIEKLALGLFARAKRTDHLPGRGGKLHHPSKRL
jgi:hypothetical protein